MLRSLRLLERVFDLMADPLRVSREPLAAVQVNATALDFDNEDAAGTIRNYKIRFPIGLAIRAKSQPSHRVKSKRSWIVDLCQGLQHLRLRVWSP
ncbi:hypothetical protein FQZ97_1102520 [compost metagenome]